MLRKGMKYDQVKELSAEKFRRLTGVKPETFEKMAEILHKKYAEEKKCHRWKGGRKPKLTIEDKLLLSLDYLREYRTMFHVSISYGVSENLGWNILKWVEDTLIKDGIFSLPGKKELLRSDVEYTVVVVDATETPIERPKKSRSDSTLERKSDTR